MDFLSAGTKKSGRCQREVAVSGGSTAFYRSARVRTLPMLTLLIFEVGSWSRGKFLLVVFIIPRIVGNRSNGSTPAIVIIMLLQMKTCFNFLLFNQLVYHNLTMQVYSL